MFIYNNCCVYWIHHITHIDMFSDGYIGVSIHPKRRFWEHIYCSKTGMKGHLYNALRSYPENEIIWDIVLIGSKDYCYKIEEKLRPEDNIGWNSLKGGAIPPSWKGNFHTEEWKNNMSISLLGNTRGKGGKGKTSPYKGIKLLPRSDEVKNKISLKNSKTYKIISPSNEEFIITNKRQFCLKHGLNDRHIVDENGYRGWKATKIIK